MAIKPLFDKVVLKQSKMEEKTSSGLLLPTSTQEKPEIAEVIAVGPGAKFKDQEIKMEVKVGDKVIYSKFGGTQIKYEGEDLIIISQADILAVIE